MCTWATSAWMQGAWGSSAKLMPFSWEGLPILSTWMLLVKFKSPHLRIFSTNREMLSALTQSAVSLLINPPCDVGPHWSWEPQEVQDLLFLSEAPHPPWAETAARVHFYLYPLTEAFLFVLSAWCSFSASSHLHTFITLIIPGPTKAGCWLSKHALLI